MMNIFTNPGTTIAAPNVQELRKTCREMRHRCPRPDFDAVALTPEMLARITAGSLRPGAMPEPDRFHGLPIYTVANRVEANALGLKLAQSGIRLAFVE